MAIWMIGREQKRFLVVLPSCMESRSMCGVPLTGLVLAMAHPFVSKQLNVTVAILSATVAMIFIIICSATTSATVLGPLLAVISGSFIPSFVSTLFRMRFLIAGDFALITRLLTIRKQMRFSTIKTLGRILELPCSMMAAGDIPDFGGIQGVVGVVR